MGKLERVEIGACLLPDEEGRLLLVRRKKTQRWEFPGDTVKAGEAAATAALRGVATALNREAEIVDEIAEHRMAQGNKLYIVQRFLARPIGRLIIPQIADTKQYDAAEFKAIDSRNAAAVGFAPAVESLVHDVVNGKYDFRQIQVQ